MAQQGAFLKNHRLLSFLAVLFLCPVIAAAVSSLSAADVEAIKQLHKQYESTWLKGDADGVRSLFTDDCVLFPPHADTPKVGKKGLNAFWFPPDAPPTQVTKLVVTPQDIGGDGQIAYVWGTDEVAWTTVNNGKTTTSSHSGRFLNVLKKQADGQWKISHHMWDDPVTRH
jgi:uncharacterized protein (TIGR02246 family)